MVQHQVPKYWMNICSLVIKTQIFEIGSNSPFFILAFNWCWTSLLIICYLYFKFNTNSGDIFHSKFQNKIEKDLEIRPLKLWMKYHIQSQNKFFNCNDSNVKYSRVTPSPNKTNKQFYKNLLLDPFFLFASRIILIIKIVENNNAFFHLIYIIIWYQDEIHQKNYIKPLHFILWLTL